LIFSRRPPSASLRVDLVGTFYSVDALPRCAQVLLRAIAKELLGRREFVEGVRSAGQTRKFRITAHFDLRLSDRQTRCGPEDTTKRAKNFYILSRCQKKKTNYKPRCSDIKVQIIRVGPGTTFPSAPARQGFSARMTLKLVSKESSFPGQDVTARDLAKSTAYIHPGN